MVIFTAACPLLLDQHMIMAGYCSQLYGRSFKQKSTSCFTMVNQAASLQLRTDSGCTRQGTEGIQIILNTLLFTFLSCLFYVETTIPHWPYAESV